MNRTFIIAEAGVNHNGNTTMAKELVALAKDAGADAVKFQTFKAEQLASIHAPKAAYQKQTTQEAQSQFQMLKELELSHNAHVELFEYCQKLNIEFLSTPFDVNSLHYLIKNFNIRCIKLASGDIVTGPLLMAAALNQRPIILSTGMSNLEEIELALKIIAYGLTNPNGQPSSAVLKSFRANPAIQMRLQQTVCLLHCVTEYPAPFADVNLLAMQTMRKHFGLPVGLSDHTEGIAVALAAVALGAKVIEKHFTLDKFLQGPDHKASLGPDELIAMVKGIRQIELAMGCADKKPVQSELKNRDIARKSLIVTRDIRAGEVFTTQNLGMKRPGTGISPMLYWDYLGKTSTKDYMKDTLLSPKI